MRYLILLVLLACGPENKIQTVQAKTVQAETVTTVGSFTPVAKLENIQKDVLYRFYDQKRGVACYYIKNYYDGTATLSCSNKK